MRTILPALFWHGCQGYFLIFKQEIPLKTGNSTHVLDGCLGRASLSNSHTLQITLQAFLAEWDCWAVSLSLGRCLCFVHQAWLWLLEPNLNRKQGLIFFYLQWGGMTSFVLFHSTDQRTSKDIKGGGKLVIPPVDPTCAVAQTALGLEFSFLSVRSLFPYYLTDSLRVREPLGKLYLIFEKDL